MEYSHGFPMSPRNRATNYEYGDTAAERITDWSSGTRQRKTPIPVTDSEISPRICNPVLPPISFFGVVQ